MLLFCGEPLVFMEMAFVQFASLGPVTTWKVVLLFKGNVSVLWYTTGVQGNGILSVCQSWTYFELYIFENLFGSRIILMSYM